MDGNEGFVSLYNFEVVDECSNSDSESYSRERFKEGNGSLRKPTEGEIDEFLENVKTLVSGGTNAALCKPTPINSHSPSENHQEPKHGELAQDFISHSLVGISSRDINIIDNNVVCTVSTNINNSKSKVSYKPGVSLVKTIFNEWLVGGNKPNPSTLNETNESLKKHSSSVTETSVLSKEQSELRSIPSDLVLKQAFLDASNKSKDSSSNLKKDFSPRNSIAYSDPNIYFRDTKKRSCSPVKHGKRRYRSRSSSRECKRRSKSRSRDRQRFNRSSSRDRHRRSCISLSQGSAIKLPPSPPRLSIGNDLINHLQTFLENSGTIMARNASNLYPGQSSYVPSLQPPYQGNSYSSNMGLGGIQQIPVGSMTRNPLSQFPGYAVPPVMNAPPPMNAPPVANLDYGSFPSGGEYNTPSPSVGYPAQQGYPGYYPSSEGIANRQKDSWGMPPPYTAAEPLTKEAQSNVYSSSSLASMYDSWNQTSSNRSEINKDVHKKRKSRSRSKSKESRKSHKKKSKRRSKSPDSLSSRGSKKHRYSKSPTDCRNHGDERPKLLIDPNRIPTPPPPPILRSYDNSIEKMNEAKNSQYQKKAGSNSYNTKNILDVENASLSSLLEAVMENSGVGKSQISDSKVKKEIINNCETQIGQLYKKRIAGFGAFIPDRIEPRQVNYRCSPLIMFHPNLSFNECSEESLWRCPGISVPDVKLVKQEIIQKLPEPAASLKLNDSKRETKGTKIQVAQVPLNAYPLGGGSLLKPEYVQPPSAPIPTVVRQTPGFVPPETGPFPHIMPRPIGLGPGPGSVPPAQESTWQGYNAPNLPVSYPNLGYNSHNWSSDYNTSWQNSNQGSFGESGYGYPQGYPLRYPPHATDAKQFEGISYNDGNQKEIPYSMQGFNPKPNTNRFDYLDSDSSRDQNRYSEGKRRSTSPRRRNLSPRRRNPSPRRRNLSPRRRIPSPRRRSPSPRRLSISPLRRRSPGSLRRRRSPSPLRLTPSPTKPPLRRHLSPRKRSPAQRKPPLSRRPHSPHVENKSIANENEKTKYKIDSKFKNIDQQSHIPVVQLTKKSVNYSGRGTNTNLTVLTTNQQQPSDLMIASSCIDHSNSKNLTSNTSASSNQNSVEITGISKDTKDTKQALPLDPTVEPMNCDVASPNCNKASGASEIDCEYRNLDETDTTEFNTDARKLSKEKTKEHKPDTDKSHNHDNSVLTFQSLYALSPPIRAIQEKSLLNKSIIDSIEKKEPTYRRLYCLKNSMLCKIEKRSKKLKIVVPRDNVKEFVEIIHKKYHAYNQIQLFNAIKDFIFPSFINLNKKISAVFNQCSICKDSQQSQKELTLSDLKAHKKPLNKPPKKIDTKPSHEVKESTSRPTSRSSNSLTTKSSSSNKTSNYRSDRSEHGRPSGYEKATKLKAPVVKVTDSRLSIQQESKTINQDLSNAPLNTIDKNNVKTKVETGMKDDINVNNKEEKSVKKSSNVDEAKVSATDLISPEEVNSNVSSDKHVMEKFNNQKEGTSDNSNSEVSIVDPSKKQTIPEMSSKQATKKELVEPPIKCEHSTEKPDIKENLAKETSKLEENVRSHGTSVQVTEPSKKTDSGLDFKTRIRNIQMNNQEFKEIISALESKQKGGIYDSYVLKAGMLCSKNISEGVSDIRILAPPAAVEEVVSIIHTMSVLHTPPSKVISFFSKHFSPIENIESLITTFVNNCQTCKK